MIIQFRHFREDKSMSDPMNHINPSVLSQLPLSFPKLHLEHSQSVSHRSFPPLHSRPCSPALHLVPAESLCSLLPSQFSGHLLSPRAPEYQYWATVHKACHVQNQYRQVELPKSPQKGNGASTGDCCGLCLSLGWDHFKSVLLNPCEGTHSARERKTLDETPRF